MNKRHLLAGALGASLLATTLPAIAVAQEDGPYAAEAVAWTLSSLAGPDGMTDVPEGVKATLFLSGGEVVGSAGCNSYFGSYEMDAENLSFGPFGATQMLCEGPAQDLEDAYLPLLGEVAGWAVDMDMLSLSTADGTVTLVYAEPPVDITATDIAALTAMLEDLQAQIDAATEEVAALTEAAAAVNVSKFDKRLTAVEEGVAALEAKTEGLNVTNLKKRIAANEEAIAELNQTVDKFRNRINKLEDIAEDHEARIATLEPQSPTSEPSPAPEA